MAVVDQGKCPECGKDLNYGGSEITDDSIGYDVTCECGFEGTEWCDIVFSGYSREHEGEHYFYD